MTIVDVLYGLEPSGILMIILAIRLLYDSSCVWATRVRNGEKPRCPLELHLQTGIACWGMALGSLLLLAMVRRDLTASGGNISWFLDAWPYATIKLVAVIGTIEIVAGVTLEDYGRKFWIAAAVASLIFMLWPAPGRWMSWLLLHTYQMVR